MSLEETLKLTPAAEAAREFANSPRKLRREPRRNRLSMPGTRLAEVLWQARQTCQLYEQVSKPSAAALRMLIGKLESAQRVTLEVPLVPESAHMSMLATLEQYARGLAHPLSRPLLIEYDHGGVYDSKAGPTNALSTRRMALVIPMETEFAVTTEGLKGVEIDPDDQGALMIWSINYFEERKEWEFAPSAAILARRQAFEHESSSAGLWQRLLMGWSKAHRADSPRSDEGMTGEPIAVRFQEMLPELLRQLAPEEISRIAREVSMDACWAALGVLSALSTHNVAFETDDVPNAGDAWPKEPKPLSARVNGHWVPLNPFQGHLVCNKLGQWIWNQGHVGFLG